MASSALPDRKDRQLFGACGLEGSGALARRHAGPAAQSVRHSRRARRSGRDGRPPARSISLANRTAAVWREVRVVVAARNAQPKGSVADETPLAIILTNPSLR